MSGRRNMSLRNTQIAQENVPGEESPKTRRASRLERILAWWIDYRAAAKASPQVVGATIQWESAQPTVWVATQANQFLGMVELHRGRYVANSTRYATYRSYSTLGAAKRALERPQHTS
jgi:hypothetical protein